jgi:uncharacterized protein YjbJ (UPF0337 family)
MARRRELSQPEATLNTYQVNGGLKQATGKAKVIAGRITGNTKTKAEGYVQQVTGKIQKIYGDAKNQAKKSR